MKTIERNGRLFAVSKSPEASSETVPPMAVTPWHKPTMTYSDSAQPTDGMELLDDRDLRYMRETAELYTKHRDESIHRLGHIILRLLQERTAFAASEVKRVAAEQRATDLCVLVEKIRESLLHNEWNGSRQNVCVCGAWKYAGEYPGKHNPDCWVVQLLALTPSLTLTDAWALERAGEAGMIPAVATPESPPKREVKK